MNNELITIIIPIYNVEKYIEQCLESLKNQTYKNIEIILINDGSTDASKVLCEQYSKNDDRFKLINKKNEGVSKARNTGIENAKGKYITFVDSDDYIAKDYINILYKQIVQNNADISICGTIDISEEGQTLKCSKEYTNNLESRPALKELLNEEYYTSVVWGKMYKKEIIQNIRFNEKIKVAEDLDFLYKVIQNIKKINIDTKNRLYYYRVRENSLTAKKFNEDWEKEVQICKNLIEDCKENKQDVVANAIRRYIRINCSCMIKILKYCNEDKINYNKLKDNAKEYIGQYITDFSIRIKPKIKLILLVYCKNIAKIIF